METLLLISSVFLWLIVLGNLLLTLTVIRRLNADFSHERASLQGLRAGDFAPPFSARTLDGQMRTLADSAGRETALLFLAPGCKACHEVLRTLEKVDPQAQQNAAELLLICNGDEEHTRALLEPFALRLPVLLAPRTDNSFFQAYQVHGTPSYYVLNEQGQVQAAGHPGSHDQPWQNLMEAWTSRDALAEGRVG